MAASAKGIIGGAVTASLSGIIDPGLELTQQWSWEKVPVVLPDINSLIAAWQRGFIKSASNMEHYCNKQGVAFAPGKTYGPQGFRFWQKSWEDVSELLLVRPEVNQLYDARIRGIIDDVKLKDGLKRIGCDIPDFERIRGAFHNYPTVGELLVARNRELISDDASLRTYLTRLGYTDDAKDWLEKLRFQIPGPSDLVRFMVREAFSPALAGPLGYYNEAPTAIYDWMAKQGYGEQLNLLIDSDGQTRNAYWTDLFWAAHWQTISPGQSYEFFHRFRPNRLGKYAADFPDIQAFTLDDVRRHLRIADYPQSVRTFLAAASSTLLGFREIRRGIKFHQEGLIDLGDVDSWAFENFRDRGYLADDAKFQVDLAKAEVTYLRQAPIRHFRDEAVKIAIDETLKNYETGIIDDTAAYDNLLKLGLDSDSIGTHVRAIDSRVSRSLVDEAVNRIERDYMSGVLSYAEAQGELTQIGIVTARMVAYLDTWRMRRDRQRRIVSAGEIKSAAGSGIIDVPTAATALERLGFAGFDESLQLADSARRLTLLQKRQLEEAARKRQQSLRELERIRREALALQRQVEGDIRRNTPISALRKWYARNQVDAAFVRDRLTHGGYESGAIDEYLTQWDAENAASASP